MVPVHTRTVYGGASSPTGIQRCTPISLDRTVARTEGYTYAARVWDLSVVHGPFSVAPRQTLTRRFATVASLYGRANTFLRLETSWASSYRSWNTAWRTAIHARTRSASPIPTT
jgi:hypothetical protein